MDPEEGNRPWKIFLATFLGFSFSDFFDLPILKFFSADMKQTSNNTDPEGEIDPGEPFWLLFSDSDFRIASRRQLVNF